MKRASLLLLLAACGQEMSMSPGGPSGPSDGDTAERPTLPTFWIEVEPNEGAAGERVVLPQRFGPYLAGSGFTLELHPAVRITGTIRANELTGWGIAAVPSTEQPVAATLTLRDDATGSTFPARSDLDGRFETLAVPSIYTLVVQPDDPTAATSDRAVRALEDVDLDVRVDTGAPLWGRVRDANGTPVPGALVSAVRTDGVTAIATAADEGGWYELRVQPGRWRLVTAEPPGERRPTLVGSWAEVDEEGRRADVAWEPALRTELKLRVVHGADAVGDVTVRLSSTALSGYDLGEATYALETRTDSQGFVEVRVPSGVYALELLPGTDIPLAPFRLDDLELGPDVDMGDLAPPDFTDVELRVVDADGAPLPSASVLCSEVLGQRRSFGAPTDSDGGVALSLPDTPLSCVVAPPGGRDDLATGRLDVSSPDDLGDVRLGTGIAVTGTVLVTSDDQRTPAAHAVVRLVDDDGMPLGTTLAGTDGTFTVRVDGR